MSAGFFSKCFCFGCWYNCVLGAMAYKDAKAAGRASRYAGDVRSSLEGNGNGNGDGDGNENRASLAGAGGNEDGNGNGDGNGDPSGNNNLENEVRDGMRRAGIKLRNDGVEGPDGEVYKRTDFGSPAKIMGKGFTKGQAMAAIKSLADTRSRALAQMGDEGQASRGLASLDMDEDEESGSSGEGATGGEGSGGQGSASSGGGGMGMLSGLGGSGLGKSKKKERKKKNSHRGQGMGKNSLSPEEAAGLSKTFNGQRIGIAMANIFLIVHQKYREKRNQGTEFINRER